VTAAVLALGLAWDAPAPGFTWKRNLSEPLIHARDGKMVFEQVGLCVYQPPGDATDPQRSFHLKIYAEAPDDSFISPDNFVAVTVGLTTRVVLALAQRVPDVSPLQAFHALRCKAVSDPPAEVEHELRYVFKHEGIEVRRINRLTGERTLEVIAWNDLYPD